MKRKMIALLMTAAMALSLGLVAGCSSTDSGVMDQANANAVSGGSSDLPVVTWKMGSTWGAGNVHFTVDQRFTELVSQLTDGRFIITNYSDGELCSASQLFVKFWKRSGSSLLVRKALTISEKRTKGL